MKTGILLPRSTVYPTIGHDFLDGCKSSLQHLGVQPELVTDNIGFGLDEKEVYSKTESMLLNNNTDVVVLFAGGRYNEMLAPLFTAMGKQLLIVNMGDYYPEISTSPTTVIEHGFGSAFNSRLTGKLAAARGNSPAVMATSYYDGGYLNVYAMVSRYQQAGGNVGYNYVSHFKKDQFSTAALEEYFNQHPDQDTMLCIYSGDVSHLIYASLAKLQQQKELNLYVSPMMLDEGLKHTLGREVQLKKTWGHTSWLSLLENEANAVFKKVYSAQTGRTPNMFSMLGWETGTLLQHMQALTAAGYKGIELTRQMKGKEYESPRGWLRTDEQTQHTYSPSYLVSVSGNFDMKIEAVLDDTTEERENFNKEKPEGATSGWRNTYLCS